MEIAAIEQLNQKEQRQHEMAMTELDRLEEQMKVPSLPGISHPRRERGTFIAAPS